MCDEWNNGMCEFELDNRKIQCSNWKLWSFDCDWCSPALQLPSNKFHSEVESSLNPSAEQWWCSSSSRTTVRFRFFRSCSCVVVASVDLFGFHFDIAFTRLHFGCLTYLMERRCICVFIVGCVCLAGTEQCIAKIPYSTVNWQSYLRCAWVRLCTKRDKVAGRVSSLLLIHSFRPFEQT